MSVMLGQNMRSAYGAGQAYFCHQFYIGSSLKTGSQHRPQILWDSAAHHTWQNKVTVKGSEGSWRGNVTCGMDLLRVWVQ